MTTLKLSLFNLRLFYTTLALICTIIFSCNPEKDKELLNNDEETEFIPNFKYEISGSGINYNTETKVFVYTFIINNTSNIEIIVDVNPYTYNPDLVFDIGNYPYTNYSKSYIKNEFRFGEGKLGHSIAPNKYVTIDVIGNITSAYNSPPNFVKLHNLIVYGTKHPELKDEINITLLD